MTKQCGLKSPEHRCSHTDSESDSQGECGGGWPKADAEHSAYDERSFLEREHDALLITQDCYLIAYGETYKTFARKVLLRCRCQLSAEEEGQMRRLAVMVCGIATLAVPAMAQQQGPNILQILDQFMTSNAVASKCAKPDGDKLAKFLLNFQIVTTHASLQMKQMSPDATPERIDKAMKDRYSQIDKKVTEIIAQETCDGPKIKEALRRFDVQAGMALAGASKPN